MSDEPGHTSGQPPAGLSWGDLVEALVGEHGTLTAVDQRAYQLNRQATTCSRSRRTRPCPQGAHPFADYRRSAGCAYGYYKLGRQDDALRAAQHACDVAGDGGYTRLRAMGLLLLAKILGEGAN